MVWRQGESPKKYLKGQIVLVLVLVVVLALVSLVLWILTNNQVALQPTVEIDAPASIEEVTPQPDPEESIAKVTYDKVAFQKVVDDWVDAQSGTAGVVIADPENQIIASHDSEKVFFAASIYKLYVAYEGYRQVDRSEVDPDEDYVNGNTRIECLDIMIRESDSPCAEKLWTEIGKQKLTDTLVGYGIKDTSMTSITTTAQDAAKILTRIAKGEGLSTSSQKLFLESMRTQVYRDALNKGFSTDVVVYNKIGFREQDEYHDTAIVQLKDGRQLIVSVMTKNVGTKNIAELSRLLESAVKNG